MAKTVAERAAELGTDELTLVRALKLLSNRNTVGTGRMIRSGWGDAWRELKPLMTFKEACATLDLDKDDAAEQVVRHAPTNWTRKLILDRLFVFIKEHERWPENKDLRNANGLPSPGRYSQIAWDNQQGVSARDYWERQVARDKRCTPQIAITLRNVLARKEAIERIGFQTFIKRGLAEEIDSHPEFGTLYRLPGETPSEPMILLKVVNSTAEPDGTFSDYYLRVPPDQTNVQEAVKWTFNGREALASMSYAPLIET